MQLLSAQFPRKKARRSARSRKVFWSMLATTELFSGNDHQVSGFAEMSREGYWRQTGRRTGGGRFRETQKKNDRSGIEHRANSEYCFCDKEFSELLPILSQIDDAQPKADPAAQKSEKGSDISHQRGNPSFA